MRIHLGCGRRRLADCVNLDRVPLPSVDVVADLERDLPFADDAFDGAKAVHVLEHIDRLLPLLAELHRVCRDGSTIEIEVPHFSFFTAYTDPTHRRFFGFHTFDDLTRASPYHYVHTVRFALRRRRLRYFWIKNEQRTVPSRMLTALLNRWPLLYERFFCWWLPVHQIDFELSVRKPVRTSSNSPS